MPHPVDIHVGDRLRFRRKLLGLSQTALGESLGVKFQQIQKYENGANRISASRLYQAASVLDVPISFFFEELPPKIKGPKKYPAEAPVIDSETTKLLGAYWSMQDNQVRKCIRNLVRELAGE